jgi:hypothetical protein
MNILPGADGGNLGPGRQLPVYAGMRPGNIFFNIPVRVADQFGQTLDPLVEDAVWSLLETVVERVNNNVAFMGSPEVVQILNEI